jgi:hypothetical protein
VTTARVTADHLRRLATVDRHSLFRDADTLIDSDEGVIAVPFKVVTDALAGNSRLKSCRLLYSRTCFIEDGIVIGGKPKTVDSSDDLDERLAEIAAGLNSPVAEWLPGEQAAWLR